MTVAEAAKHLNVSDSLIYAWCADGTLPHMRVGRTGKRGHIRIAVEDLDAVMAAFKVCGKVREPIATPTLPTPKLKLRHLRLPSS